MPLGLEDVLKMMGANLRTNLKERTKGKYSGKDQHYLHLQSKQKKMKAQINSKKVEPKQNVLQELDISECDFSIGSQLSQ